MIDHNNLQDLQHEQDKDERAFGIGCFILLLCITLAILFYPVLVTIK